MPAVNGPPLSAAQRDYLDNLLHGIHGANVRRLLGPVVLTKKAIVRRRLLTRSRLATGLPLDVAKKAPTGVAVKKQPKPGYAAYREDEAESTEAPTRRSDGGRPPIPTFAAQLKETYPEVCSVLPDDAIEAIIRKAKQRPASFYVGEPIVHKDEPALSAGVFFCVHGALHFVRQRELQPTRPGSPPMETTSPEQSIRPSSSARIADGERSVMSGVGGSSSAVPAVFHSPPASSVGWTSGYGVASSGSGRSRPMGSSSEDNAFVKELVSPCIIGLDAVLGESHHPHHIVAALTEPTQPFVDGFWLPAQDLLDIVLQYWTPPLVDLIGKYRQITLAQSFPQTIPLMRHSWLCAVLPDSAIRNLIGMLKPLTVFAGEEIVTAGDADQRLFFLRRGYTSVWQAKNKRSSYSASTRPSSSGSPSKSGLERVFLAAPGTSFGEMSLLFNERRTATVKAETTCDFWVLHNTELAALMKADEDVRVTLQKQAAIIRTEWLGRQRELPDYPLRNMLARCTVFDHLPMSVIDELVAAAVPRVFPQRALIGSTSCRCDRLYVLVRGVAMSLRANVPVKYASGDVIGEGSLQGKPFRWPFAIAAGSMVDSWELEATKVAKILRAADQRYKALVEEREEAHLPPPPPLFRGTSPVQARLNSPTKSLRPDWPSAKSPTSQLETSSYRAYRCLSVSASHRVSIAAANEAAELNQEPKTLWSVAQERAHTMLEELALTYPDTKDSLTASGVPDLAVQDPTHEHASSMRSARKSVMVVEEVTRVDGKECAAKPVPPRTRRRTTIKQRSAFHVARELDEDPPAPTDPKDGSVRMIPGNARGKRFLKDLHQQQQDLEEMQQQYSASQGHAPIHAGGSQRGRHDSHLRSLLCADDDSRFASPSASPMASPRSHSIALEASMTFRSTGRQLSSLEDPLGATQGGQGSVVLAASGEDPESLSTVEYDPTRNRTYVQALPTLTELRGAVRHLKAARAADARAERAEAQASAGVVIGATATEGSRSPRAVTPAGEDAEEAAIAAAAAAAAASRVLRAVATFDPDFATGPPEERRIRSLLAVAPTRRHKATIDAEAKAKATAAANAKKAKAANHHHHHHHGHDKSSAHGNSSDGDASRTSTAMGQLRKLIMKDAPNTANMKEGRPPMNKKDMSGEGMDSAGAVFPGSKLSNLPGPTSSSDTQNSPFGSDTFQVGTDSSRGQAGGRRRLSLRERRLSLQRSGVLSGSQEGPSPHEGLETDPDRMAVTDLSTMKLVSQRKPALQAAQGNGGGGGSTLSLEGATALLAVLQRQYGFDASAEAADRSERHAIAEVQHEIEAADRAANNATPSPSASSRGVSPELFAQPPPPPSSHGDDTPVDELMTGVSSCDEADPEDEANTTADANLPPPSSGLFLVAALDGAEASASPSRAERVAQSSHGLHLLAQLESSPEREQSSAMPGLELLGSIFGVRSSRWLKNFPAIGAVLSEAAPWCLPLDDARRAIHRNAIEPAVDDEEAPTTGGVGEDSFSESGSPVAKYPPASDFEQQQQRGTSKSSSPQNSVGNPSMSDSAIFSGAGPVSPRTRAAALRRKRDATRAIKSMWVDGYGEVNIGKSDLAMLVASANTADDLLGEKDPEEELSSSMSGSPVNRLNKQVAGAIAHSALCGNAGGAAALIGAGGGRYAPPREATPPADIEFPGRDGAEAMIHAIEDLVDVDAVVADEQRRWDAAAADAQLAAEHHAQMLRAQLLASPDPNAVPQDELLRAEGSALARRSDTAVADNAEELRREPSSTPAQNANGAPDGVDPEVAAHMVDVDVRDERDYLESAWEAALRGEPLDETDSDDASSSDGASEGPGTTDRPRRESSYFFTPPRRRSIWKNPPPKNPYRRHSRAESATSEQSESTAEGARVVVWGSTALGGKFKPLRRPTGDLSAFEEPPPVATLNVPIVAANDSSSPVLFSLPARPPSQQPQGSGIFKQLNSRQSLTNSVLVDFGTMKTDSSSDRQASPSPKQRSDLAPPSDSSAKEQPAAATTANQRPQRHGGTELLRRMGEMKRPVKPRKQPKLLHGDSALVPPPPPVDHAATPAADADTEARPRPVPQRFRWHNVPFALPEGTRRTGSTSPRTTSRPQSAKGRHTPFA